MSHARAGGGARMNPHTLESNYVAFVKRLETRMIELAQQWPALKGFWERWYQAHRNIAHSLSSDDSSIWQKMENDSAWNNFLKFRQRLISTLGQGLNASACRPDVRDKLRLLLAEHDRGFIGLLQKELERVREQMTQAFAVRNTVSAYAQTAQYRRE